MTRRLSGNEAAPALEALFEPVPPPNPVFTPVGWPNCGDVMLPW